MGGSFQSTSFEKEVRQIVASTNEPVTFYDSVSGKALFKAPVSRSIDDFIAESKVHGWPSFRDDEVVWENVRVLKSSGETVSTGKRRVIFYVIIFFILSFMHLFLTHDPSPFLLNQWELIWATTFQTTVEIGIALIWFLLQEIQYRSHFKYLIS